MPTYEYLCEACEHTFEEFQLMTARPLRKCPECGKSKLKRLIGTGAAVIFKGSGFYETDYRSDDYKKSAKAEKEGKDSNAKSEDKKDKAKDAKSDTAKSEKKTSSETKTESKPAPKGDAKKD